MRRPLDTDDRGVEPVLGDEHMARPDGVPTGFPSLPRSDPSPIRRDGSRPQSGNPRDHLVRIIMAMLPHSDDVLLAGFGVGDVEATATFVRRYQSRVFGLAQSVLNDRALAEDVSQEVFLRAWRHAGSYDPRKGSVPTWLLTITRNAAVDAMRMRRPEPVDPAVVAHLDITASESNGPAHQAEVNEDMRGVKAVLADLPGEQRRALLLASVCGRTANEIAQSEGIPLGTAKTRIRAGLLKVRGALASSRDGEKP